MTWKKSIIGPFNGKWLSIQIVASKKSEIFSRKLKKATHPPLLFNNNNVFQVNFQTHFGVILDVKLIFEEHLKNVFNKTNETIGLLKKLSNLLPRQALVTIYKAFIRPHLDYGDVLYDQAFNNSFNAKMESIFALVQETLSLL